VGQLPSAWRRSHNRDNRRSRSSSSSLQPPLRENRVSLVGQFSRDFGRLKFLGQGVTSAIQLHASEIELEVCPESIPTPS